MSIESLLNYSGTSVLTASYWLATRPLHEGPVSLIQILVQRNVSTCVYPKPFFVKLA